MKPKTLWLLLVVAVFAAAGGWWAAQNHERHAEDAPKSSGERKIRFYQCSMHPQVKSDRPGKCPICGMELTPIYEGQGALSENLITLDSNAISVVNVQTELIKRQPLHRTLRVAGTIDDDDTRHRFLSAYNDGRVEKLFVNYLGAEVQEGQPLAAFYSPSLLAAEREYLVLIKTGSTNNGGAYQEERQRLLSSAAQRLKRLGLTEAQIEALGESGSTTTQTEIVAPMSGTVVNRFVYEGQYVKEGDRLFEIADFSTMWFRFDAYENDLPYLKVGQTVTVTTPSVPNKVYESKIGFIDPNLNDPTRSAKVRVEIQNPVVEENGRRTRQLLHRLYAEGIVKLEFPDALIVPRSAVLNPGGEPLAYVEAAVGSYELRKIKLGMFGDEGWQVLEGLNEGERVVTSGNLMIDAQAQFNIGSATSGETKGETNKPTTSTPRTQAMTDVQQNAVKALFSLADGIANSLASDDLKSFNGKAGQLPVTLANLTNSFAKNEEWQSSIHKIEVSSRLQAVPDLAEARKLFLPFSSAVAEFAEELRTQKRHFVSYKIFKCPMVNQAVPEAPKNGFWLQLEGPLRNPFFGSAMLDCGSEVKP
jgi:Cu(I)/Ag(I) efflux system membrane fusion protein